jgi:integrase
MRSAGKGEAVTARSYRLLRAILSTALEDELIAKNPCSVKGAGTDHTAERPVATIEEVYRIADAVDRRFRALVLTAAFTSLREGELFALTRRRVDLPLGRSLSSTSCTPSATGG